MDNNKSVESLLSLNFDAIKKEWIDFKIKTFQKDANEGCGQYYEIYEDNFFGYISHFIEKNQKHLSDEDIAYIKYSTGYTEDYKVYTEIDLETGEEKTIYDIARESMI